ncbi:Fic family protein [Candidatus Woesearchaeota archaeon]|nr:Fic family protein [Candidatus Woesearchaeota archaeon]
MILNKKDIIAFNQEIGESGNLRNESSLEFALSAIKEKPWMYKLSYLMRCLLVDHCFEDGNKRTALAVAIIYFDYYKMEYEKEKIIQVIYRIAKSNIINVNKIMRMIKDATI